MKYLFFGTPEFAAIILEKLINVGFIPEAVVCNPDKPMGRKKVITSPPVKQRIMNYELRIKNKIKILQPEKLEIGNWKLKIDKLGGVDFAIIAAYSKIIPKTILDSLPAKFIGIHPSLLPKYRGPSPIQAAILNGDEKTGTTLFLMDEKVDHGAIIANSEFRIQNSEWNYENLLKKLAELSADLLIGFLRNYENVRKYEKIKGVPQDESQATYTKKFTTQDAYIEPIDLEKARNEGGEIALIIDRKIRALNPEPGVWTYAKASIRIAPYESAHPNNRHIRIAENKRMKILEAEIINGRLKLTKIQFEGKKPVEI